MFESSAGRMGRIGARARATPMSAKAPIRHLDPTLVLVAFALTAFGNLMVYSASYARLESDGLPRNMLLMRQLTFSLAGLIAMIVVASFSYRRLKAWGPLAYAAGVTALVLVLSPFGSSAKGAQRWIDLGFFQFQPSEFMKLAVLVVLALYMSERRGSATIVDALRLFAFVAIPGFLIYKQPDLGTMLVFIAITMVILIVGGTRLAALLLIVAIGIGGVTAVLQAGVLQDYQVARLKAFLDPDADPQRTGYNLNQARIGVGSGQLTGKGLFSGSQTNLDFVPEVHTDFIFVAVGEELGFAGSVFLLFLFGVFLWRGVRIAMLSKDLFGTLLASGIVAMFAFQMFVNIGMTIGVSPVTGIPLPFVSYGGSSLITTFVATGILLNIHMRRAA